MTDSRLPVYQILPELKKALENHATAVLQAPPGAGKSTVLPLELIEEHWLEGKKLLMLEPRRLAAKAVAWRLAEQRGEEPGGSIGFRVRFESRTSKVTRIEVVTEGILTRMLQQDNALEEYGLVIFDEFHERSLHADLALALCRQAQTVLRPELRILIMSATLDSEELMSSLHQPPLITSEGRQFPVEVRYREADETKTLAKNVSALITRAAAEEEGDMLVFLPGSGDIHRVAEELEQRNTAARIVPLYGDLPHDEQQSALLPDPYGRRKIILSTSLAETSLTIEGIRVVVDSGYSRVPRFDLSTGLTRLETVRSSRDTCEQRAGRAGRLGPGICYRMWPEATHAHLSPKKKPEILQADLAPLCLEIAGWGTPDPEHLLWVTSPPPSAIEQGMDLLHQLGALSQDKITDAGKAMLRIPAHPRIAHLLLMGEKKGHSRLAADVAALLEDRDPFREAAGADLSWRVEQLQRWRKKERIDADRNALQRVEQSARQWRSLLQVKDDTTTNTPYTVGELVAAAFPERIARKEDTHGRYRLANGRPARLQESDPLTHESWLAVAHLDAGQKEGKIFLAAPFDPEEIVQDIQPTENLQWDDRQGLVVARKEWRIGKLVAKSEVITRPDKEKVAELVAEVITKTGLHLFERTDDSVRLQARVESLRRWRPELGLPDFSDEGLLTDCKTWGSPFFADIKRKEDLRRLDLHLMLMARLSYEQQRQLAEWAPEKLEVPSGSEIRIDYSMEGGAPVVAVRLQEVFGLQKTPSVNDGRNPLVLHLLSPGYKPVQVTQDLISFWTNTYPEVRRELRIRYPKHSWPDDPFSAQAIRGPVKKRSN